MILFLLAKRRDVAAVRAHHWQGMAGKSRDGCVAIPARPLAAAMDRCVPANAKTASIDPICSFWLSMF
jgi:hypothetical protein